MINLALIVVKQLWWRKRNFVPERLGDPGGSGPRSLTSQVVGAGPGSPIFLSCKQDVLISAVIPYWKRPSTETTRLRSSKIRPHGAAFVRSVPNILAECQASAWLLAI